MIYVKKEDTYSQIEQIYQKSQDEYIEQSEVYVKVIVVSDNTHIDLFVR